MVIESAKTTGMSKNPKRQIVKLPTRLTYICMYIIIKTPKFKRTDTVSPEDSKFITTYFPDLHRIKKIL